MLISGTFNRKQTPYNEKLKTVILTATGLLVEDAVSSFFQYFYFELYNDIEVWKRRTLMEKTIMTEVFQVLDNSRKHTNSSKGQIATRKASYMDLNELSVILSNRQAKGCFVT